jgi:small subunit ribosomal protein S11
MKKQINVYFTLTSNNVFGVTQNLKKNISASCGKLGFKGSNRSTPHAAQTLAEYLGTYLNNQKINEIILFFKGLGKGRRSVIKGLQKQKISIFEIIDKTSLAHNGCRPKKKRRI